VMPAAAKRSATFTSFFGFVYRTNQFICVLFSFYTLLVDSSTVILFIKSFYYRELLWPKQGYAFVSPIFILEPPC
jgi:hypothetical protein